MSPRLLITIVIFTVTGLIFAVVLNLFNIVALSSIYPAQLINRPALEARKFFTAIREISTLRNENAYLANEVGALKRELTIQSSIIEKNLAMQDQINKALSVGVENIIPATVISRSPSKILDIVIVNAGSMQGVSKGDAALVNGFLAGIVSEVGPASSRVELITSPRTMIPVRLVSSRARGLLQGGLTGIEVNNIPGNTEVPERESVVSDIIDSDILPDIPIGEIGEQVSADSEILKKFLIKSPINFNTFEFLVIVPTIHEL